MNKIKLFVKKWYFSILIVVILGISITANVNQHSIIKIKEINIIALTDSLKTTKNKLNETVKSKSLLVMDINDLKKSNSELTQEINKLSSKDKRNLIEINKLNITIDMLVDSLERLQHGPIVVINDSTKSYPFSKINKFRELRWDVDVTNKKDGTEVVTSAIKADKIYMDLVINKKKEDNKLSLSVSSSNPYVNVTDIKGSIIDLTAYNSLQKPKLFGLGVHVGYGISTNNGVVFLSPYIGVGLSYNLIRW